MGKHILDFPLIPRFNEAFIFVELSIYLKIGTLAFIFGSDEFCVHSLVSFRLDMKAWCYFYLIPILGKQPCDGKDSLIIILILVHVRMNIKYTTVLIFPF